MKNQLTREKKNEAILGLGILPPLNGERLVIPVLLGAMDIDIRVDTRLRHGSAIGIGDLALMVTGFGAVVEDGSWGGEGING